MTLYELNQKGYAALPELKGDAFKEVESKLRRYLSDNEAKYYMMLNFEKRYFTLFTYEKKDKPAHFWMALNMIDIAQSLGTLKAIEIEGDMAEFWITNKSGECNMYSVFPYDKGVITI